MEQEYLKIADVATMFGISVSTVWRWAKGEDFPSPIKVGTGTFWKRSEIEALINKKSSATK